MSTTFSSVHPTTPSPGLKRTSDDSVQMDSNSTSPSLMLTPTKKHSSSISPASIETSSSNSFSSCLSSFQLASPKRPRLDSLQALIARSKSPHVPMYEFVEIAKRIHLLFLHEPAHTFISFPISLSQWLSTLRSWCVQSRELMLSSLEDSVISLPSMPLPSNHPFLHSSSSTAQKNHSMEETKLHFLNEKEKVFVQAIQSLDSALSIIQKFNILLPFVQVELGVSELAKIQATLFLERKRFHYPSFSSSPSSNDLVLYLNLDLTHSLFLMFNGISSETSQEKLLDLCLLACQSLFDHAELLHATFQKAGLQIALKYAYLALQCAHHAWYQTPVLASESPLFLKIFGDLLRWLAVHSLNPSYAKVSAFLHSSMAKLHPQDPSLLLHAARTWCFYANFLTEPLSQKQAKDHAIFFYESVLQWTPHDPQVIQELYALQPRLENTRSPSTSEDESDEEYEEEDEEDDVEVLELHESHRIDSEENEKDDAVTETMEEEEEEEEDPELSPYFHALSDTHQRYLRSQILQRHLVGTHLGNEKEINDDDDDDDENDEDYDPNLDSDRGSFSSDTLSAEQSDKDLDWEAEYEIL
ncbi:hypothetical protein HMI54_001027 [Coelomomyces lativittatus]|nr:hypothetical protein HMI54_001027 [Coelomomyces lativittatus]